MHLQEWWCDLPNHTVFVGVVHSLVLVTQWFDMALRTVFVGHTTEPGLTFSGITLSSVVAVVSSVTAQRISPLRQSYANNRRFTARATAAHTVMLLAADVGFVSFDDVSESITVSGFAGRCSGCAGA